MSLGRMLGIPMMVIIPGIFLLTSCLTEEPSRDQDPPISDSARNGGGESEPADSAESFPSSLEKEVQGPTEEQVPEVRINPLEEVAELWYAGRHREAQDRFWKEDVESLKDGPQASEWAIWRGRLFSWKRSGKELGLAGENVSALAVDMDDVWVGTWTGGITRLSVPLETHMTWDAGGPSLAVRTVNRIRPDLNHILVVRYGALERYEKRTARWITVDNLPVRERLQDVLEMDGITYLGTLGHGFWRSDGRYWTMIRNPGLFITRMEYGNDGEILIATMDRGLYILEPETMTWIRPPKGPLREVNITSVAVFQDLVACGTYGQGGYIWNRSTSQIIHLTEKDIGDKYVLSVIETNGRFYFGTFGAGLRSRRHSDTAWDSVALPEGLPSVDLASLAEGSNGEVWIGTLGGGIVRLWKGIHGDEGN